MSKTTLDDLGKLLLRICLAVLILFHGAQKLANGTSGIESMIAAKGFPYFLAWGVYVGEVLAPLLLLLGVYSRLSGLLIAANMTVALWLVHSHQLYQLNRAGGWEIELQVMFLCAGLCVALLGAGRFSFGGESGKWN